MAFCRARASDGVVVFGADGYARTITVDYGGGRHIGWLHARDVPQRHAVALTLSPSLLHAMPPLLARARRVFTARGGTRA